MKNVCWKIVTDEKLSTTIKNLATIWKNLIGNLEIVSVILITYSNSHRLLDFDYMFYETSSGYSIIRSIVLVVVK